MANLYLDKAGLQILLTKLNEKYEGKFLGIHAIADEAKKVSNGLTLNVGGEATVFDGSGAKSLDVAAAKHTHKAVDVSDFATEVKKVVFGDEEAGEMDSHIHENLEVLNGILAADVSKWNAKIGVDDVTRIKYQSANMSSVTNVKEALDVLAANVILAAGAMAEADGNMKQLEAAIDAIEADYLKAADKTELQNKITALEAANEEGGAVAKAIADAQKAADDAQAAADAAQGEVDALEGVVAQFKLDQAAKDGEQDTAIAAKVAQADYNVKVKALEDEDIRIAGLVATEQGRAEGQEAAIRSEFAAADDILEKAIQDIEESLAKGEVAEAIEAAKDAADAAQADVDAIEKRLDDENGLVDRLEAVEAKFAGDESVDAKIAAAQAAAEAEAARLDGVDRAAQLTVDQEQDRRLDVIETAIGEGGALESRVAANEAAIDVINGEGEGSIKKAVADLVDGAPAALDTLNELAAALRDNADVLDAVEEAFDGKLATLQADVDQNEADCDAAIKAEQEARAALKTELQKEIDDDVKVVADALANEKDATKDGSLAKKIADEIARADAEEKDIRADFAAADQGLAARIAVFEDKGEYDVAAFKADYEGRMEAAEDFMAAQPDVDKDQNDRLAALEAKVDVDGDSVDDKIAAAKQEAIEAAAGKDAALKAELQGEIDADVEAEAKLRDDADKALEAKIDAINNASTGILAQAKKYADDQDAILKKDLQDEIDADVKVVADELAKQQDAAQAGTLANRIAAFEANGANDVAALEVRVKANEDKLAAIGVPMNETDINEVIAEVFK